MAAEPRWLWPSTAGALLAAAIVLLAMLRGPQLGATADYHVLSGALEHTTVARSGGAETLLATEAGGVVELAHARVELGSKARARWNAGSRALRLEQGVVMAEVDPTQHRSFQVDTENFRAVVLGTKFEVSRSTVRVERGRVRVERPDGTLLRVLAAGEAYECAAAPCPPSATNADGPSAAAANGAAVGNDVHGTAGSGEAAGEGVAGSNVASGSSAAVASRLQPSAARRPRGSQPERASSTEQLNRARLALAQRDIEHARELIAGALATHPPARDQAEALSLRAECAMVAGDLAGAAAGYRYVASRFANLPAGESALFASARIEADLKNVDRARAAFQHYLARYPHGRFAKEAAGRLTAVEAVPRTP